MPSNSIRKQLQLGIDLQLQRDHAAAKQIYCSVLELEPTNGDALHLLGMMHFERQEYDSALTNLRLAIQTVPHSPAFQNALGVCLRKCGDPDLAASNFVEAIRLDPNFVDAHENLGELYVRRGRWSEATKHLEIAVTLSPDRVSVRRLLATAARQIEDYDAVIHHTMHLVLWDEASELEILPLATYLTGSNSAEMYLSKCRDALQTNPRNRAVNQLVGCVLASRLTATHRIMLTLREQRDVKLSAIDFLVSAAKLKPDYLSFDLMGRILARLGKTIDATVWLRKAIHLNPKFAPSFECLGHSLLSAGQTEQAKVAFEQAVQLFPKLALANYELSRFAGPASTSSPDDLLEILSQEGLSREDQALFHLAIANRFARQGRFDEAAHAFVESGRIKIQNETRVCKDVYGASQLMDAFPKTSVSTSNLENQPKFPTMIFVVGLPRSGTTLVEQILSCHHQVFGCGELDYLSAMTASLRHRFGFEDDYPKNCKDLNASHLSILRQEYMDEVIHSVFEAGSGKRAEDYRYLIDKMPTHFRCIGFIRKVFPEAKIIEVVRDVRDVAISCLLQNLDWPFCHPEPLVEYVEEYVKLMNHFRTVERSAIHTVRYEDLVESQKETTRSLLQFLDLPWQEECMSFYALDRIVNTPSKHQVRQPMYRSSIGVWKKYASAIPDFFEKMELVTGLHGESSID